MKMKWSAKVVTTRICSKAQNTVTRSMGSFVPSLADSPVYSGDILLHVQCTCISFKYMTRSQINNYVQYGQTKSDIASDKIGSIFENMTLHIKNNLVNRYAIIEFGLNSSNGCMQIPITFLWCNTMRGSPYYYFNLSQHVVLKGNFWSNTTARINNMGYPKSSTSISSDLPKHVVRKNKHNESVHSGIWTQVQLLMKLANHRPTTILRHTKSSQSQPRTFLGKYIKGSSSLPCQLIQHSDLFVWHRERRNWPTAYTALFVHKAKGKAFNL